MDRNLLLAFALSFAVLMLWSLVYQPARPRPSQEGAPPGAPAPPGAGTPGAEPLPERRSELPLAAPPAPPSALPQAEIALYPVERPTYRAVLTSTGAGLESWELTQYHEGVRRGRVPVSLTTGEGPWEVALLSPFSELGLGDLSTAHYELESSTPDRLAFRLTRDGVTIRKVYSFDADGYALSLRIDVVNGGSTAIAPRFAVRWPAHVQDAPDFTEFALVAFDSEHGNVITEVLRSIGQPGFLGLSSARSVYDYPDSIEWAGAATTYFLSALLPDNPAEASVRFLVVEPGKSAIAELFFEPVEVPPGQSATREYRIYLGPKEPQRLEALGGDTLRSIDLGWPWVRPMTTFFSWMLRVLYSVIPNYGVGIIVLTILVRVVTAPLTNRQMRSMERMRALAPRLKEIQEKYKDDRQKQSEETMRLYRQEKVNPLGGCLPMVLQLPVFIGLFYALRSSIDLRQAPFVGWIDDLSAPETLFTIPGVGIPVRVLPLVMGATMVLQQRMTPMPSMDPTQARMMTTVMPIMMTVVFYQFPSGLVLYWMVSNVLAIAHQRWIGRRMAR